jgi:hypothetical protein
MTVWPEIPCLAQTEKEGLYEFFINRLRHPYAFSLSLPTSMSDLNQTNSGLRQQNADCETNRANEQRRSEEDQMKTLAMMQTCALARTSLQSANHQFAAKVQVAGVVLGLVGGLGSGLLGGVLIVAGWLTTSSPVQDWLSAAGSVLLILTIPLIILGACCLDWLEKDRPK